jgi:hypothetical protein
LPSWTTGANIEGDLIFSVLYSKFYCRNKSTVILGGITEPIGSCKNFLALYAKSVAGKMVLRLKVLLD